MESKAEAAVTRLIPARWVELTFTLTLSNIPLPVSTSTFDSAAFLTGALLYFSQFCSAAHTRQYWSHSAGIQG